MLNPRFTYSLCQHTGHSPQNCTLSQSSNEMAYRLRTAKRTAKLNLAHFAVPCLRCTGFPMVNKKRQCKLYFRIAGMSIEVVEIETNLDIRTRHSAAISTGRTSVASQSVTCWADHRCFRVPHLRPQKYHRTSDTGRRPRDSQLACLPCATD